ncbi:acyltransferase [Deltaproteobacteria bacterium TL4]
MGQFFKRVILQIQELYLSIIVFLPGEFGNWLRRRWLEKKCKKVGVKARVGIGMDFGFPEGIEIGDNLVIGRFALLQAGGISSIKIGNNVGMNVNVFVVAGPHGNVIIEDDVIIGPNVVIRASDHRTDALEPAIRYQGHVGGQIIIRRGCWIGANSVVTKNVTIGEHSVVGAGSVVTHDVEPYTIVGGVPATLIKKRN